MGPDPLARAHQLRWLSLGALLLSGCFAPPANLEGDWDGEIDCGPAGRPDIQVEIEETDDFEYEGLGTVERLELDGVPTEVAFRWIIDQGYKRGGQELEIDAECFAVPESGDSYELDCSDVEELGWDGEDELGAEIEDFLSTNADCELQLER